MSALYSSSNKTTVRKLKRKALEIGDYIMHDMCTIALRGDRAIMRYCLHFWESFERNLQQ